MLAQEFILYIRYISDKVIRGELARERTAAGTGSGATNTVSTGKLCRGVIIQETGKIKRSSLFIEPSEVAAGGRIKAKGLARIHIVNPHDELTRLLTGPSGSLFKTRGGGGAEVEMARDRGIGDMIRRDIGCD